MLIDTHCHLDDSKYDADREEILARAKTAGVELKVTIGTTAQDSRWAADFARDRQDVKAAVGVHPEMVENYDAARDLNVIETMAGEPGVVAIGEVGLDYHRGRANLQAQHQLFREMIRLSLRKKLPLVIHQREAEEDTLRLLREEGGGKEGGVFHCYAGSLETAQAAMRLGFDIAVGGILTFKSAQPLRDVISQVPMDRLVLETDAPWLAPQAWRGQRNEPAYMTQVADQVAVMKGLSSMEVAEKTSANARRLFRLGRFEPQEHV
jgi:TatD DNase family protein